MREKVERDIEGVGREGEKKMKSIQDSGFSDEGEGGPKKRNLVMREKVERDREGVGQEGEKK